MKSKTAHSLTLIVTILISLLSPLAVNASGSDSDIAYVDRIIYNTVTEYDYLHPTDTTVSVAVNIRRAVSKSLQDEGYTVKWAYGISENDNAANFTYQSPMPGCTIRAGNINRTILGDKGFSAGVITVKKNNITFTHAFSFSVPVADFETLDYATVSAAAEFSVDGNGKVLMYSRKPDDGSARCALFPRGCKKP